MSRRSRRNAVVVSGVPEVVGRDFTDDSDVIEPFSQRESVYVRQGVPLLLDSLDSLYQRPLTVIPTRSIVRGYGGRKAPMTAVRLRVGSRRTGSPLPPSKSAFTVVQARMPKRIAFCVARKVRREVIFAKRYSGRNGAKVYRRTYDSQYRC